jgi:hypothetical protein
VVPARPYFSRHRFAADLHPTDAVAVAGVNPKVPMGFA